MDADFIVAHIATMPDEQRATHFKGWARPGPVAPGHAAGMAPDQDESLDALSGHSALFQLKDGHRFSTDDLLTAWYGTTWCPAARTALDLGSGVGTVGMIAAWRLPGTRWVTVEAQARSVDLARKSAVFNGLTDRYDIRLGDFRTRACCATRNALTSSRAARRIFHLGRVWKADTRRNWRAVSSCEGRWRTIAWRQRATLSREGFLPAFFRPIRRSLTGL